MGCTDPSFNSDGVDTRCSDLVSSCSLDDFSEESTESTEDPIVDVGRPGRRGRGRQPRRPRNMNTRRNQTMMNYTRRGSGGSGGCPGSLEDCVAACPTKVARVYTVCVDNCGRVCSKK